MSSNKSDIMENKEAIAILFGIGLGFLIGVNVLNKTASSGTNLGTGGGIIIGDGKFGEGTGNGLAGDLGGGSCQLQTGSLRANLS